MTVLLKVNLKLSSKDSFQPGRFKTAKSLMKCKYINKLALQKCNSNKNISRLLLYQKFQMVLILVYSSLELVTYVFVVELDSQTSGLAVVNLEIHPSARLRLTI